MENTFDNNKLVMELWLRTNRADTFLLYYNYTNIYISIILYPQIYTIQTGISCLTWAQYLQKLVHICKL